MAVLCYAKYFVLFLALYAKDSNAYITWFNPQAPLEGTESPPGAPWPMPSSWSSNPVLATIDPTDFLMTTNLVGCDIIDNAITRYASLINLDDAGIPDPDLTRLIQLNIVIIDPNCASNYYPYYGMDEAYSLEVLDDRASINSETIWGALRGLETFSQLIYLTPDKRYQLNETTITDFPRFAYRGLHIDTARHFLRMSAILKIIDAMSWDKLNVLHWHVVDDQSFPYPSRIYPELQTEGSYTPYHQYTRADVATILAYTRERGILVIPEFDTPGHTISWGKSHPELLTPCYGDGQNPGTPNYPWHAAYQNMDPSKETTYTFLDNLYDEIVQDFPENLVHLGMDEAWYDCWASSPEIAAWMATMNFTQLNEVEGYFNQRLIQIVENKGAEIIMWEDPINNGVTVSQSAIVEVWLERWQDHMLSVVSKGYDALLASPWYLNYISYGEDWKNYYNVEPHNFTDDQTLWNHVKGGEACMWGEFVDGTNVLARLWPRVSAVAERLWSPKTETDTESAKFRLDQHRCHYLRRGIQAQPILNGYCGDYEWDV